MDTFGLKIIASDKVFYEGRCRKLVIPAPDGEKGILPNHENMVIAVTMAALTMSILLMDLPPFSIWEDGRYARPNSLNTSPGFRSSTMPTLQLLTNRSSGLPFKSRIRFISDVP